MSLSSATENDWGIEDHYVDVKGHTHRVSPATRAALLKAMGVGRGGRVGRRAGQAAAFADVVVVRGSRHWTCDRTGQLRLEDGTRRHVTSGQRVAVPLGYHHLRPAGARRQKPILLIVAPATCPAPPPHLWGWAVQLYAARSRSSWGIGDLGDLLRLARWSKDLGADVLMVNPLVAPTPTVPIEPSPYFPSSRRFRNPVYLRIEDVPGARDLEEVSRLAASGRGLNARRTIDRDAAFALKMTALEACFARFDRRGEAGAKYRRFRAEQGRPLTDFAVFCAIAERHGGDWRSWPRSLRHPRSPAVVAFARRHAARVDLHAWLQWLLDVQLARAARHIRIIQDLPVGIQAGGADAWCWQDLLAEGVSVGVPPDEYNPPGQDWGLVPFVPHKLRGAGYQPLIETIRATLRHAGGLRIDHLMGLFALYWIPRALGGPAHGGYVRTSADELLAIVALESHRAGAFVVGEDLGTVAPGVREKMAEVGLLSYRLLFFEKGSTEGYPERALAAVTTHDLPTVAGLWTGSDLQRARLAGVEQNELAMRRLHAKIRALVDAGVGTRTTPATVIERTYAALARAPSRIRLVTLDDALAVEERPNLPGARPDWPNWAMALPGSIEELPRSALARRLARLLSARRAPARSSRAHA